jgi:FAD binding domain-containing protein
MESVSCARGSVTPSDKVAAMAALDLGNLDVALVQPGEAGWEGARQAWNLAADQRPVAVVLPETAADVAAVVDFARERGLRVTPQATGHRAGALASLERTLLLKTSRMRAVEVDAGRQEARVEAGAQWGDVVEPAAEHGLAALAGTSPGVGIVGYTLGGGLGWLGRKYGLAANSVLAAELVTADGQALRVDLDHEPELFWAVRGGGGGLGVVTALEFRLYPVRTLYAGDLFWPIERAGEVLHAWRSWVESVPDEMTSLGRLLHMPPLPQIPEPFRGRSFVSVESAYLGDEADGRELLEPLRGLAPELDTVATIAPPGLAALHMDPPEPVPGVGDGALLEALPAEAVDAVVEVAGPDSDTALLTLEIRALGGALARTSPDGGALAALDAPFAVFGAGMATPDRAEAVAAGVDAIHDALAPWESARTFFNFSERPREPDAFFAVETLRRLREQKRRVDPDELFRVS